MPGRVAWWIAAGFAGVGILSALALPFGGVTEREGDSYGATYTDYSVGMFSDPALSAALAAVVALLTAGIVHGIVSHRFITHGRQASMRPAFWLFVAAATTTLVAAGGFAIVGEDEYFMWWLGAGFYVGLLAAIIAAVACRIAGAAIRTSAAAASSRRSRGPTAP